MTPIFNEVGVFFLRIITQYIHDYLYYKRYNEFLYNK